MISEYHSILQYIRHVCITHNTLCLPVVHHFITERETGTS